MKIVVLIRFITISLSTKYCYMLLIFNTPHGLAIIFLRDSLCLSAVSFSRQRHDILDFSCCPLSRVLHVILANWQRFGFEFHLRSSPSAYSGFVNISRLAEYFTACYTVAFSLDSIVSRCRCPVKLSSLFTSLSIFG